MLGVAIFILSIIGIFLLAFLLVILWAFCIDCYTMSFMLRRIEKECKERAQFMFNEMKKIGLRLENCPSIEYNSLPIRIWNYGDYNIFIIGDKNGKPRLFLYHVDGGATSGECEELVQKSGFRKRGRFFSVSSEEFCNMINKLDKELFKREIENKKREEISNYFR